MATLFLYILLISTSWCYTAGLSSKQALAKINKILKEYNDEKGVKVNCGSGWMKYKTHCYMRSPDKRKWLEAESFCRRRRGHLVKIDDVNENKWVASKLPEDVYGLWLGGHDSQTEGQWVWIGDSKPIFYHSWAKYEPNGSTSENCLHMFGNKDFRMGKWNDIYCHAKLYAFCEKELGA